MNCAVSAGGLLVHSRPDWPCAICRPWSVTESRGFCLCLPCAHRLVHAVEAGVEGARELLADLTDVLAILEAHLLSRECGTN